MLLKMWKLFIFTLICCIIKVESRLAITPSIVGGNNATFGQFPYFVSIRYGTALSHGCGGGIINTRFVLTAAHCMTGTQQIVVAGVINLSDLGTRFSIIRSIPHPNFRPYPLLWNDIGLLQLDRTIIYTNLIQPVPINRLRTPNNVPTVLAGHGAYQQHPPYTVHPQLQYLHSNTMSNAECIARSLLARFIEPDYRPIIHSAHICAFASIGVGGCYGDSGSPLVSRITGQVLGVVVSGLSCARGAPDFYARVSSFSRWIDQNSVV